MQQPSGNYSIKITAEEGRADGLVSIRKIGRDNRGVLAYAVPRQRYAEALRNQDQGDRALHERLARSGVYILWEPSGWSGRHKLYVGESSVSVGDQLLRHHNDALSFWQTAFVLVDLYAEEPLNSTQHRYLKAELYRRAKESGLCEVTNQQKPQHPQDIVRQDVRDADAFLEEAVEYLRFIGVEAFEAAAEPMPVDRLFKFVCRQIAGIEPGMVVIPGEDAATRAPFKVRGKSDLNFATVHKDARELRITLNLRRDTLYDPRGIAWDNPVESRGTAHTVVTVNSREQLPYVLGLVRQSFEKLAAGEVSPAPVGEPPAPTPAPTTPAPTTTTTTASTPAPAPAPTPAPAPAPTPPAPRPVLAAPSAPVPVPPGAQSIGVSFEGEPARAPQPAAAPAPAAGVAVEQKPEEAASGGVTELTFRFVAKAGKNGNYWNAVGRITPDNRFVVVSGSVARSSATKALQGDRQKLRTRLIEGGIMDKVESHFVFSEDYDFESPSVAATVVAGHPVSGGHVWECEQDGRLLWEHRPSEPDDEDKKAVRVANRAVEDGHQFEMSRFTWRATGRHAGGSHRFVVEGGSTASHGATESLRPAHRELRESLIKSGVLAEAGTTLTFTADHEFNSPSQAASVVSGGGENGLDAWRSKKDARSLAEHLYGG